MKKNTICKSALAALLVLCSTSASAQQTFGSGNLAVLLAAASANNTTVSVLELDKVTSNQTAIQTIAIPATGTDAIRVSGSASSTLYAANSNDGSLFCFTGHNSETTSGNINAVVVRAVMALDKSGTITKKTTYSGTAGNQTRCASTIDNTNFFIGDQVGLFTNNATAADPAGNFRGIKAFGGTMYAFTASASLAPVGTFASTTGATFTALPGLPLGSSAMQDFCLISSGANGTAYDVLYILSARSATMGRIDKYSLVSGTWTPNDTVATTYGGFGLVAEKSGTGANLYLTTGTGATVANQVLKVVDAAGYNATINISGNTSLYTATAGTILKGIAFAPKSVNNSVTNPTNKTWLMDGNKVTFFVLPSAPVEIFSLTGSKLASFEPADVIHLNLQEGIYFMKVDSKTTKIFVK